jgi:hypothetical protein
MSKKINDRIDKYVSHKASTLANRVYLAIIDKIFDAENYDVFEIDSDNNIYITYSLKRDESIIADAQDLIADQVKRKYRKQLEEQLEEESYFVEYDDNDIHVYFEEPLKTDNKTDRSISSIEHNVLTYKKNNKSIKVIKATLATSGNDSGIFDFGDDEN